MDFELDEGQRLLRDSATALLAERFPLAALQALAIGEPVPDLWPELAELGWTGLLVPEEHGGSSADVLAASLLAEQLGYAGLPSPFVHSAIAATGVMAAFASSAQAKDYLPGLAAGSTTLALAISEASGEFDPEHLSAGFDGRVLSGQKTFVHHGEAASAVIVVVREGDGLSAFLVPADRFAPQAMRTLDGLTPSAFALDGIAVSESERLGAPGMGEDIARLACGLGALARAAEIVGLSQRVLDIVVEHIAVREQSGQPIGSFQALQHSAADMLRDVEGARGITYRAAWGWQPGAEGGTPYTAMAKAYASTVGLDVVRRGHQLMGAIGYCEEHPLHILHKRIHAAAVDFGTATAHFDRIAPALGLTSP